MGPNVLFSRDSNITVVALVRDKVNFARFCKVHWISNPILKRIIEWLRIHFHVKLDRNFFDFCFCLENGVISTFLPLKTVVEVVVKMQRVNPNQCQGRGKNLSHFEMILFLEFGRSCQNFDFNFNWISRVKKITLKLIDLSLGSVLFLLPIKDQRQDYRVYKMHISNVLWPLFVCSSISGSENWGDHFWKAATF